MDKKTPKQSKRILFTQDAKFAISAPGADKPVTLSGYALVWNSLSKDRGGYKVRLKPYSAKIATASLALFHHDNRAVLGNTENATLRFAPDDTGVKVEIDLPNTSTGRDVAELVGKKYIRGMSFGMLYDPEPKFEAVVEGDETVLEFSEFTLDEVTVTAIPAFADTSVEVKDEGDDNDEEDGGDYSAPRASIRADRAKLDRLKLKSLGS